MVCTTVYGMHARSKLSPIITQFLLRALSLWLRSLLENEPQLMLRTENPFQTFGGIEVDLGAAVLSCPNIVENEGGKTEGCWG